MAIREDESHLPIAVAGLIKRMSRSEQAAPLSHFTWRELKEKVMVKHSQRPYEPSPVHILKRMVKPLCRDFELLEEGTKNDTWQVIEGFSKVCSKALREDQTR